MRYTLKNILFGPSLLLGRKLVGKVTEFSIMSRTPTALYVIWTLLALSLFAVCSFIVGTLTAAIVLAIYIIAPAIVGMLIEDISKKRK